jgi:amino acid adenylation domain-containing protein
MCIPDLIRVQATARSNAIAVTRGAKQITYRQLDGRAEELASLLRALGARPEVPVALCMRRSCELVVGALGILRAGAAYVPLDPTSPTSRLAMLLEDSAVPLVVTQPDIAEHLPAGKWRTIVLDENGFVTPSHSDLAFSAGSDAKPENLAYIIFTSGSTGRPKGVQITHANLLNLISWHNHAFNVTSADKASLHASPGFDASVWELWPYLAAGASVHIVDDEIRTSPERLRDWMVATGLTITFLPTALAESMINLSWPEATSLRFLLTGADTLRHYPPTGLPFALVNNYGPTECTVVATSCMVPCGGQSEVLPSIGRAIQNVQTYIVDENLNRVPDGTEGELAIGGAGVGRGYLNLPELTSQQFVTDRFSGVDGARLYRTGDLARILADGQIAFLGRKDEQIKIRGYRIEPAEITAVLNRHPAIRSGFVIAASEDSGEKRLLAYVVLGQDAQLSAIELREFLGQNLPDYMIPTAFVKIANLPVTANGKVDRSALPKATPDNTLEDNAFEDPQSEIEIWLANFLSSLLKVNRVSRDDNFFNLGGHSLMGAQLIAKVQQTFDVELTLRGLFDHPTVREISCEIESLIEAKLNALSDDEAQHLLDSSSRGLPIGYERGGLPV